MADIKFFYGDYREFIKMHTEFPSLYVRFGELFSKYGHLNELLESEKVLGPLSSGAFGHVVQIFVPRESLTINTLSTVNTYCGYLSIYC